MRAEISVKRAVLGGSAYLGSVGELGELSRAENKPGSQLPYLPNFRMESTCLMHTAFFYMTGGVLSSL